MKVLICPECGDASHLTIQGTAWIAVVGRFSDGAPETDASLDGEVEYHPTSPIVCQCGHEGTVADFEREVPDPFTLTLTIKATTRAHALDCLDSARRSLRVGSDGDGHQINSEYDMADHFWSWSFRTEGEVPED